MGMTKSALNTLWLTGGGLVATWFAVTPMSTVAVDPANDASARRAAQVSTIDAVKTAQLKVHHTAALKPVTRNPFAFGRPPVAIHARAVVPPAAVVTEPVAIEPSLTLSGIAAQKAVGGSRRTAIISGDSQLYLVTEGDMVAGRYRVVTVGEDNVVLRDDAGRELRLSLK